MTKSSIALVGAVWMMSTVACARHAAERVLVDRFFSASRLRDRTALQQISTVIFEPLQQGTITTFTVTGVADLEQSNGQVVSKQVTVEAPVRLPRGGTATRRIF